jgi:hypothetical protein
LMFTEGITCSLFSDSECSSLLFPFTPTMEHRASVKRFVWLQFLNAKTIGRNPWTGISQSQGHYLYKHRINTNIHALSGIRTHDPSVRASEDSSCLRPHGHCDRCSECN